MQHNFFEDLLSIFNPPQEPKVKPTPPLVSPPKKSYEDLFKFLLNTIVNTPTNLEKAFTYNTPEAKTAPDKMSNISNTAIQGTKGIKELKKLFNILGS